MTTVIEMAEEADLYMDGSNTKQPLWVLTQEELERFAELVRADERERWAQVCDEIDKDSQSQWPKRLATMLRARSNT